MAYNCYSQCAALWCQSNGLSGVVHTLHLWEKPFSELALMIAQSMRRNMFTLSKVKHTDWMYLSIF